MAAAYKNGNLLGKANILKKSSGMDVLRPPIPPKNGHLSLLGTIGFTCGAIGSEEDNDLHLQRGKVKEEVIVETEPGIGQSTFIERKKTIRTTSMVIIQANGRIIRL